MYGLSAEHNVVPDPSVYAQVSTQFSSIPITCRSVKYLRHWFKSKRIQLYISSKTSAKDFSLVGEVCDFLIFLIFIWFDIES